MASHDEKSAFAVIVEEPDHAAHGLFDTPKTASSLSLAATTTTLEPTRPCPAALNLHAANADPEKGLATPHTPGRNPLFSPCREYSVNSNVQECSMWPSRQTLAHKARQEKNRRRGDNCLGLSRRWGAMTKRQRLTAKILIGLLVVALAVGVALGISRAVGGGIWTTSEQNKGIDTT